MKAQIQFLKNVVARMESHYMEAERCGGGLESHALGYARDINSDLNQLRKLIEEVQPDVDAYIRYQQDKLELACANKLPRTPERQQKICTLQGRIRS